MSIRLRRWTRACKVFRKGRTEKTTAQLIAEHSRCWPSGIVCSDVAKLAHVNHHRIPALHSKSEAHLAQSSKNSLRRLSARQSYKVLTRMYLARRTWIGPSSVAETTKRLSSLKNGATALPPNLYTYCMHDHSAIAIVSTSSRTSDD